MKRLCVCTLLLTFLLLPLAALASEEHGSAVKVQGEVLDMACYIAHGAKGEDHAGCATKCLKDGQPMGLLAADGTVYLLYAGHDDPSGYETAKGFAGKQVEISGKAATKGGIHGIEVQGVKGI